jgi:hypothetical protein
VTSYAYDAAGRRSKVLNTAIQAAPLLQQGYTSNGALATLTDANSNTTTCTASCSCWPRTRGK